MIVGATALAAVTRPRLFSRTHAVLDLSLGLSLAAVALQLVPLPAGVRTALAPGAAVVDGGLLLQPAGASSGLYQPLTIDPPATQWAFVSVGALMLIFWCARSVFERSGGVRTVARGIAWLGLVLAVVMLVQKALSPEHIYGIVSPTGRSTTPEPHGPFVNRNDFALWVIMALPVVAGYMLARLASRAREGRAAIRLDAVIDERMTWLIMAAGLLMVALFASLSRGGLAGLVVALAVLGAVGRGLPAAPGRALLGGIAAVVAAAAIYSTMPALTERFDATLPSGLGGRLTIWRETWPMVPDFLYAGTGAGAFERAMLVYQQSTRLIFFNHAHNQYLQILVEGGLLLAVPAGIALMAGVWQVRARLRMDLTPMFWIRAGAAAALAAACAHSVWDSSLRIPANGVLFAIVAALALHDPK